MNLTSIVFLLASFLNFILCRINPIYMIESSYKSNADGVKLSNTIALLIALVIFPYIFIFQQMQGLEFMSPLSAVLSFAYITVPVLNHFKKYLAAKIYIVIQTTIEITVYSMVLGGETLLFVYFFSMVLVPLMFFSYEEKKLIFFSYLLILVNLIVDISYKYFTNDALMSSSYMPLIIGNIAVCFCLVCIYSYRIVQEKYHYSRRLEAHNQHLTDLIDQQIEAEEKLIKARELAESVSEAKQNFLSSMSHELRTPLNAVIGITNILIDSKPNEDQVDNLNVMKFSADNLLSLINDILDYNKIIAGKLTIEHVPFQLHEHVANLREANSFNAKDRNNQLVLSIEEQVPTFVKGDPVRIAQVLNNLINNAIKFTENGTINIRLKQGSPEDATVTFEVEDSGVGIAPENIDKIFKDFEQAEASTNRKFGGTGLGLPISKKLLHLMNAEIFVHSEVGKGTTFTFTVPFGVVKEEVQTQVTPQEHEIGHQNELVGKKVLLVEDNLINVKVVAQFLKKWGMSHDWAENGEIAVKMASKNAYDLILMDLHMPVMNGYEATKIIRTFNPTIPIIALTASALLEVKGNLLAIGMNGSVTKPFVPATLKNEILKNIMITAPDNVSSN
ncbi:hypothetical protein PEPS_45000 (plasmid) [Persicobacter psychrovividus]|uniref:histidine kinase n=2 Tax=Persicobacter psychrovividus TaxID=387638 RepID=A0ABN6LGC1_9BACT|nr:hypothetical protein PEPS_45000 [Persicobacter psychrovividus]